MKISATIITFNEERNIKKCIESLLEVADEVIVVDSFSTDDTERICKSFDKLKFYKNSFEGHIQQKNYAVSKASYNFVLSLDADEQLSDDLIQELNNIKIEGVTISSAYSMPRLNNYCGKWIRHCGWYPDRKIRLWDKRIGTWGGTNPHDHVVLNESAHQTKLLSNILHYTFSDITEHVEQSNKFSDIAALELFRSERKIAVKFKMLLDPLYTFFRMYFIKLGMLDGFYGLIISVVSSYEKFLKYAKLKKLQSECKHSLS